MSLRNVAILTTFAASAAMDAQGVRPGPRAANVRFHQPPGDPDDDDFEESGESYGSRESDDRPEETVPASAPAIPPETGASMYSIP